MAKKSSYVLDDYGLPRRVLAWVSPESHHIGSQVSGAVVSITVGDIPVEGAVVEVPVFARNTADGLSVHLTDDPNTVGDVSPEGVQVVLGELAGAGLVKKNRDGSFARTAAGVRALGGTVYADK